MTQSEHTPLFETEEPYGLDADMARQIEMALEDNDTEQVTQLVSALHTADLADFIATTTPEYRKQLIELIHTQFVPDILLALDHTVRRHVVELLGREESAQAISTLDVDDAVYVIEDLPEDVREEIVALLPTETQYALQEALAYPEHSAGRLMQKKVVSVPEYWTVGQTIDYLRQNKALPDDFYEIFVVDAKHRPIGGVLVSRMIRSQRSILLHDLMERDLKIVPTDLDQEEVSFIFQHYALTATPVVNRDGRLVGVISIDDVVEVIEEEAEEDMLRMGGVRRADIHAPILQTAKHRFFWLFVNLFTAFLASRVVGSFGHSIEQLVVLAALMPIVPSMGGNAGTQALTVMTRAIATKEITPINRWRVVGKEVVVGGLNGIGFALLAGLVLIIWYGNPQLALVFGMAMVANLTMAGLAGASIPLIFNRMGIDPAITSSVFVTTVTDVIGFLTFLGLATLFLI